jgi:hypothetical protein
MNFSDSFYFTVFADYADYNYFTDFVKTKNGQEGKKMSSSLASSQKVGCRPPGGKPHKRAGSVAERNFPVSFTGKFRRSTAYTSRSLNLAYANQHPTTNTSAPLCKDESRERNEV